MDTIIAVLQETSAKRGHIVTIGPDWINIECIIGKNSITSVAQYGRITIEVITDLIAYFENAEEPMNIYSTELFKYLAGDMIGQKQISLTIASVTIERMNSGKGGEQAKPCLHFKERDKLMVLNKTNAGILAQALGPETDDWAGASVTISAPQIEAFGKTTRSLKVINVTPPYVAPKSRNAQSVTNSNAQPALATETEPAAQDNLFGGLEPEPQAGAFVDPQ